MKTFFNFELFAKVQKVHLSTGMKILIGAMPVKKQKETIEMLAKVARDKTFALERPITLNNERKRVRKNDSNRKQGISFR